MSSFSKVKAFNHAISAMLLSEQVSDTETNKTNIVRVLNQFWDDALTMTLQEMDLDSLSESITLELLATLDENEHQYRYAYKYPTRCAFMRRIRSCARQDTIYTAIDKKVQLYNGVKAIYTDQEQAVIECVPVDISLDALSSPAGMAVSYLLAYLSAPLVTGKGAKNLRQEIFQNYLLALDSARELDARENRNFETAQQRSEWVSARTE